MIRYEDRANKGVAEMHLKCDEPLWVSIAGKKGKKKNPSEEENREL